MVIFVEKQPEHHFADRQRPYKRRDDHRPRMEERLDWSRRDEEHPRDRDTGQFVRGRWSVVYNRYINCNVWRYHMPTNYADRRHARVSRFRER
ncbi:hypothetical protein B566_EDAN017347 [Ephemera danica]|nr:hypothetical protein B566_EDAN017347 [Ephemera danica]